MLITNSRNPVNTNINHSQSFSIANLTKLFKTFSNIYSDPVRAVVRELICNAMDASPGVITVIAPSALNPYLTISDTGPGMDEDFMLTHYTEVGFSTKDGDNEAIGGFGWGRLSALALCDTYTVTTQGRVYVLTKDEHGIPRISMAGASDETGTHIRVPIPQDKRGLMTQRLQEFLRWLPEDRYKAVGVTVEPVQKLLETEDVIVLKNSLHQGYGSARHYVMMGPVIYEVDYTKVGLKGANLPPRVILKLPIGALELPPSRESITYGPVTTQYLEEFIEKVKKTLKTKLSAQLRQLSFWDRFTVLSEIYDLKDYNDLEEWEQKLRLPVAHSHYVLGRRSQYALSPRPSHESTFEANTYRQYKSIRFFFQDVPDRVYDRIRDVPQECVVFKPCPWVPDAATLEKYLGRKVEAVSSLPLPPKISYPKNAPLIYDHAGNVVPHLPDGAAWGEPDRDHPYPRPPIWYQLGKGAQKAYLNETHEHLSDWRKRVLCETRRDPALRDYLAAVETSIPYWWQNFLFSNPNVFPEATAELNRWQQAKNYSEAWLLQYLADLPSVKPMKLPQINKIMRNKKRLDAYLRAGTGHVRPDDFKLFL